MDIVYLRNALRDLGITERVAGDLLARYPHAYLWRMVLQTRYMRRQGMVRNPAGWFIASVRGHWHAPAGFDPGTEMNSAERREALIESWGVCRRCGRRPCHCEETEEAEEGGQDAETDHPQMDEPARPCTH